MKALEVTGTIDEKGQLLLDRPLTAETPGPVRIIVLLPESIDEDKDEPDDTTVAEIKVSLRRALQEAKAGQRIPLSEMWDGIDVEKGQSLLDRPLTLDIPGLLRIILLLSEPIDQAEEDPDDTTVAEIKASLKRALKQAKAGKTRPISELWERIDSASSPS